MNKVFLVEFVNKHFILDYVYLQGQFTDRHNSKALPLCTEKIFPLIRFLPQTGITYKHFFESF